MWCGLARCHAMKVTSTPGKETFLSCTKQYAMYGRDVDERKGVEPETPRE